jgi:uncharacterized membrane protein YhaH (DUF805 family)
VNFDRNLIFECSVIFKRHHAANKTGEWINLFGLVEILAGRPTASGEILVAALVALMAVRLRQTRETLCETL